MIVGNNLNIHPHGLAQHMEPSEPEFWAPNGHLENAEERQVAQYQRAAWSSL